MLPRNYIYNIINLYEFTILQLLLPWYYIAISIILKIESNQHNL